MIYVDLNLDSNRFLYFHSFSAQILFVNQCVCTLNFFFISEMDFINEINEMLMTSSSSDSSEEEYGRPQRRHYRMVARNTVDSFDDIDFGMYFRVTKRAFWRLHEMVCRSLDRNRDANR